MPAAILSPLHRLSACLLIAIFTLMASPERQAASAQEVSQNSGRAFTIDLEKAARDLSMSNMYNRSLYLFIRNNPAAWNDGDFYVNFLVFLMTSKSADWQCRVSQHPSALFFSEFERREFFTNSFQIQNRLLGIIQSKQIPQRYDLIYEIETGAYDFTTSSLNFDKIGVQAARGYHDRQLHSHNRAKYCSRDVFSGLEVKTETFPWEFDVVDENVAKAEPAFPFTRKLQLPSSDARLLLDNYGRTFYSIVSYQIQAANNGRHLIQILPTEGNLFAISVDKVVPLGNYTRPGYTPSGWLDFTNPLRLFFEASSTNVDLRFQQRGFRAQGSGNRQSAVDFSGSSKSLPMTGTAAVGNSAFIARLSIPQLPFSDRYYDGQYTEDRFVTLFGSVDLEQVTKDRAPLSGKADILSYNRSTRFLEEVETQKIRGYFTPPGATPEEPEPETSALDKVDPSLIEKEPAAEAGSSLDLSPLLPDPSATSSAEGQ